MGLVMHQLDIHLPKLGRRWSDPAAALLELLDPETGSGTEAAETSAGNRATAPPRHFHTSVRITRRSPRDSLGEDATLGGADLVVELAQERKSEQAVDADAFR
jgi:hypothetical protein